MNIKSCLTEHIVSFQKNTDFIEALENTAEKELVHSIGKNDARKTVLTEYEFIYRLSRIRDEVIKR